MVTEIIALLSVGNGCQVFSINSTMGWAGPSGASKELRAESIFFFHQTQAPFFGKGCLPMHLTRPQLLCTSCVHCFMAYIPSSAACLFVQVTEAS